MSEVDFYGKALSYFHIAKVDYKAGKDFKDRNFIDTAAYMIQQSIEFMMKFYLTFYNVVPEHTHNLDVLLQQLDDNNIIIPFTNYIYDNLTTISTWQSNSRYGADFFVSDKKIERVFEELDISYNNICDDLENVGKKEKKSMNSDGGRER